MQDRDIPGKSKSALHDETDLELATDADLNTTFKGEGEEGVKTPAERITVGEAIHIHNKQVTGDDVNPSAN